MTTAKLEASVALKGRYKCQVIKGGKVIRETDFFDNLITDLGMNQLGTSAQFACYGQVGSSSTAPSFSDTSLGARINGTQGQYANGYYSSFRVEAVSRYAVYSWRYTFLSGSAAGNISEVGVSNNLAGTQLSSRALVKDSGGNPTTITVLSDEDFVLVWELWVKQPTIDFTSTASGKTITIRACNVNASTGALSWSTVPTNFSISPSSGATYCYVGSISTITGAPSGTSYIATSVTTNAYIANSYTSTGRMTWGTNTANAAIKSFSWVHGFSCWQCELDTALPTKLNTQTLRLDVSISWSRDSGPA